MEEMDLSHAIRATGKNHHMFLIAESRFSFLLLRERNMQKKNLMPAAGGGGGRQTTWREEERGWTMQCDRMAYNTTMGGGGGQQKATTVDARPSEARGQHRFSSGLLVCPWSVK